MRLTLRASAKDPRAVHPVPLAGAALKGVNLTLTFPAKSVVVVNLE